MAMGSPPTRLIMYHYSACTLVAAPEVSSALFAPSGRIPLIGAFARRRVFRCYD